MYSPRVTASLTGVAEVESQLGRGLEYIINASGAVQKYLEMAHAKAVEYVSGVDVAYKDGYFVINRQTGTLARRFRTFYPNALSGVLVNEAEYASYVEDGHPAVDLKPYIMGKTIPLRIKGKLIFRRVTVNSKGWIVPAKAGRPFMKATAAYIEPLFADGIDQLVTSYLQRVT